MLRVRRLVQLLVTAAFVAYLVWPREAPFGQYLFKLDALAIGGASLASRAALTALVFAALLVVVTLLFGRVFCGWVCPLGALSDGVDYIVRQQPRKPNLRRVKTDVLIVVVCLAVGGISLFWLLDPLNWAARIGGVFGVGHIEFGWVLLLGGALLAIEAVLGKRGFCRVLCPLGALLGAVGKVSGYKFEVSDACIDCGDCVKVCRARAFTAKPSDHDHGECIHCRECEQVCPTDAIKFRYFAPKLHRPDPLRRSLVFSLAGGVGLTAAVRFGGKALAAPKPTLRPPGTVPENRLHSLCIRCGSCLRACPTGGIVGDGPEGLLWWQTPRLSGREGGCAFDCNICGQVCPTGAIKPLKLDEKKRLKLGVAKINQDLCIAYHRRQACLICYAVCPVDAIKMTKSENKLKWGEKLLLPEIIEGRCIGCGLCETACPVAGAGAIVTEALSMQKLLVEKLDLT